MGRIFQADAASNGGSDRNGNKRKWRYGRYGGKKERRLSPSLACALLLVRGKGRGTSFWNLHSWTSLDTPLLLEEV